MPVPTINQTEALPDDRPVILLKPGCSRYAENASDLFRVSREATFKPAVRDEIPVHPALLERHSASLRVREIVFWVELEGWRFFRVRMRRGA